jgi:transposase
MFPVRQYDTDSFSEDWIVSRNLFWLSDEQWRRVKPHLPTDVRGKDRVDDRRVISGILHVLRSGCRWCDCPEAYGPPTTIYNRFVRWARRGVWENLFRKLAGDGRSADMQMIDSTHVKAHRSAAGGKGGSRNRRLAARAAGATRRSMHSLMLRAAFSPSS